MSHSGRRNQLVRYLRAQQMEGALVFSWRRGAVSWLTGYTPGFVTNQAALWQPVDGDPQLGVRFPFEKERASRVSGIPTITYKEVAQLIPGGIRSIGLIAGDMAVDESLPHLSAGLEARGIDYIDLRAWTDDAQEAKLPAEIAALRRAGEVAAASLMACGAVPPVGWRDYQVAAAVEYQARTLGASRATCLVGIGAGSFVTECTNQSVRPGDQVCIELTIYVDGWCMHVNHSLIPGAPRPGARLADQVCREARFALVSAMRPGLPVDEIVRAGDDVLRRHKLLAHKEYDFGHGVGSDTPQHPRLIDGTNREIAVNSVVAVHVAVRAPDGPTGFVGGPVLVGPEATVELVPGAPWTA